LEDVLPSQLFWLSAEKVEKLNQTQQKQTVGHWQNASWKRNGPIPEN